jgi:hypothetical protein
MEEDVSYQLSTSVNDDIVEIVVTGKLTKDSIEGLRTEGIKIFRETKAKAILWDIRAMRKPLGITEGYFRARNIPPDVRAVPADIVEQSGDKDFQTFYETTASNAGLTVNFFTDIEAARVWLKSKL